MPLSATEIRSALAALSEELESATQQAEIIVVGGAALVLLFHAREATKDVDAVFVRPEASQIRDAAARVAIRMDLPSDWLNDGAKGYLVGLSTGDVLYESRSLVAHAASTPQLLAMKLAAWRDAIDRADAEILLAQLPGNADDIWAQIKVFVPPHQLDKASYAFEDLWESSHGPS
jgi:predicted nucleotidyltransferase